MNRTQSIGAATLVFLLGLAVGAIARGPESSPSLYRGKSKAEAAKALLDVARAQAEKGSWEIIAVGRVLYLSGGKAEGQQLFDQAVAKKTDSSDLVRIGRVYYDAKEYGRAFSAFDRALQMKPKDPSWLAEIGAYYNLQGNRAKAEELFDRAFAKQSDEVWITTNVAGSYVGVEPLR